MSGHNSDNILYTVDMCKEKFSLWRTIIEHDDLSCSPLYGFIDFV